MEISIGKPMLKDKVQEGEVKLFLKTLTLHGLIGGSTGTGKSKAIQVFTEQLIDAGVPVLLADLKGDMEGFIKPNTSKKVKERAVRLKMPFSPKSYPSNFFSVSGKFVPLRLKLDEMDPALIARVLKLNSTQESNLKLAFIYAKKKKFPIRDFVDLKEILSFLSKKKDVSGMSKNSVSVILRQISIVIGDGLNELFGEPSLEIKDLLSQKAHVLDLGNWRKRSDFPSILMAFILYRLFNELDDVGSVDKPRIVLFIDEAHYLFTKANPHLTDLFVTVLKQIRSKGVSVFLSSQNPEDIPEKVLEQLGCKIQFALRAFTQEELKDIRGIARSFPPTKKLNLAEEIMSLNIAEAIVSPLNEKGRPLQPVKTAIFCPNSSMEIIPDEEIEKSLDSALMEKYGTGVKLERYDLSLPMEGVSVKRYDRWSTGTAEAMRYSKKQSRMARKQWKRMKTIGTFLLAFIVLVIIVLLLVLVILK